MQNRSHRPAGRWAGYMSRWAGLLLFASLTVSVGSAQSKPSARTVWDGAFTAAQADRGTRDFGASCAGCHSLTADGRLPLVGEVFWKSFSQKTVGDMLEYVSTYMPNGAPGSLTDAAYRDIAALMLSSNGFPAGTSELGPGNVDALILPEDGSTALPDDALARVVGCLTKNKNDKNGNDWVVTSATKPERPDRRDSGTNDATRPLGDHRIVLKYVLTNLDKLAGSRVAVQGLLIGEDGADGINVTRVNQVASDCR